MRYGNCVSYKDSGKIKILKAAGYDYIETGLSSLYGASTDELSEFIGVMSENKIQCEAVNVFFKGGIVLVGDNADFAKAQDYVGEVCEKTKNIGFKAAVFGSGGARRCPDGFPKERAVEQIIKVTREILAPAAEKYGFVIAVEELNKGETNTINTLSEAEYIANQVNHKNVKVLADLYHIAKEGNTLASGLKDGSLLAHCHIASPSERKYPQNSDSAEDIAACRRFFADLRAIGYDERMSIEGGLGGLAESIAASPDEPVPDFVSPADRAFYLESKYSLEFMKGL